MIYVEIILKQILSPISRRGGRAIGFIRVENRSRSTGGLECDIGEDEKLLIILLGDNFTKSLSMFAQRVGYSPDYPEDVQ